jgi:hypothetical protein
MVNDVITDLQTPEGIAIYESALPDACKTRWVYLLDVRRYTLSYRGIGNEVCDVFEHDPIPELLPQFS